ncbi:hypothetical protein XBFM1_360010 [Xenorhabdus bovienii str. feltiae Moldova]|uniref:Uncharacterized protein n=1 Tax=Xenorhabdus bovienii str. feltiae Moldova TaxID=1398200 RepID=A0A077NL29_XENBV|nr:hypothetical protein XBFM1_360010 [Xenorhabdus bovienii str. feltiae Moldova]
MDAVSQCIVLPTITKVQIISLINLRGLFNVLLIFMKYISYNPHLNLLAIPMDFDL